MSPGHPHHAINGFLDTWYLFDWPCTLMATMRSCAELPASAYATPWHQGIGPEEGLPGPTCQPLIVMWPPAGTHQPQSGHNQQRCHVHLPGPKLYTSALMQVFISYITGTASDICKDAKRQTISADDVFSALSDLGFESYIAPTKHCLEGESVYPSHPMRLRVHDCCHDGSSLMICIRFMT